MADEQQSMSQSSLQTLAPKSRQTMKLMIAASIGVVLLGLSGVTLTGTMIGLIITTPVLILFSPVIVPAGIMMFVITTGFLFSGGCSVLAMAAMAWIYKYMSGKHPFGAAQFDYARIRIANKARDMTERAKENGHIVQQNKPEEATQDS